jgi:hypothetical protein
LTGIQQKANQLGYSIMLNFVNGSTDDEIFATPDQIAHCLALCFSLTNFGTESPEIDY